MRDGAWRLGRKEGYQGHPILGSQVRLPGLETQGLDSTALESSLSCFIDKKIYTSVCLSIHPSIFTDRLLSVTFFMKYVFHSLTVRSKRYIGYTAHRTRWNTGTQ